MNTFTKLVIINAITLTAAIFASFKGVFSLIILSDISYISLCSMIIFAGFSLYTMFLAFQADKLLMNKHSFQSLQKDFSIVSFATKHFVNLGLLGTCIGFCYMINSTLVADKDLTSIINELKTGAGTALYTTLVGITCSMLLSLHLFVIQLSNPNE